MARKKLGKAIWQIKVTTVEKQCYIDPPSLVLNSDFACKSPQLAVGVAPADNTRVNFNHKTLMIMKRLNAE